MQWRHPKSGSGRSTIYLVLAALPLATASLAAQPDHDCTTASDQIEQLICADQKLAALDRQLTAVYAIALQTYPLAEQTNLKVQQRGWLKGRNACRQADDVAACIEQHYRTRIVELQITSGQLPAPETVSYACTGFEGDPLFATFYSDTTPASVVLVRGDNQAIAFIARSGSGARYTAAGIDFWEHQGEATVNWYGTGLNCRLIEIEAESQPGE